jgi:hypothetical protein
VEEKFWPLNPLNEKEKTNKENRQRNESFMESLSRGPSRSRVLLGVFLHPTVTCNRRPETMDEKIVQEILHELLSSLEALDMQSTAILQFLKDKGIASDEELASHLEQAGNASSVRWRAVRVRIEYLLSGAIKSAQQEAKKEPPRPAEESPKANSQEAKSDAKQANEKENVQGAQQVAGNDQPQADAASASAEKSRDQPAVGNKKENTKEKENDRPDKDTHAKQSVA